MKLFGASLFTLSIISSFVFGLIILILIYTDAVNIQIAIILTIVINFLLWLVGPYITDWFNKWLYKVEFLNKETFEGAYPEVASIISQIANEYRFPFPKIGIIRDKNPTAFTYGSARFNARIIFTEGLFHYLTPQEIRAVVAHEMGHIVNRDFIIMMIASTLVQILYEIYAVLIRAKGKKSGNAKLIALAAYVLYIISTYMLFYLSRTREKLADEFAAKKVFPQDMANALIKIAYGIIASEDSDSTKRLLESTRHLGIVDVKNAKHIGIISYITHNDPKILSEVMIFDKLNPWAKLIELSSTHPLTGNRLDLLGAIARKIGAPFVYDVNEAVMRLQVNKSKLYSDFISGFLIYLTPVALLFIAWITLPIQLVPIAVAVGLLIQIIYKYPGGDVSQTTILDQMRNPYASPIRGKPIMLSGQVIGRGVPGYIFSEDMMYQDKTGLTFLDYTSFFGFLGNLFFALTKIKTLFTVPSRAEGWFFRSMSSSVALKYIQTEKEKVRSHPIIWSLLSPILLMIVSLVWLVYPLAGF